MFQSMKRYFSKQSTKRQPIVRRRFQLRVEELQARVLPSVTAFVNPAHQLVINGDEGANSVNVSLVNTNVHVAAGSKSFDFDSMGGNVVQIVFNGKGGRDVFVNNTAIPSIINGGNGNDVLVGGAGDDSINGGEGNDTVFGGSGADSLQGGNGRDSLDGGADDDFIAGGAGRDSEHGGSGNDIMVGGADDDSMHGDDGNDYLAGGAGRDSEHGDSGDDILLGGAGDDTMHGDDGNDFLVGLAGSDTEHGGSGDDYLSGDAGNDHLFGDDGNDQEHGGAGNDDLSGDNGDDDLSGDIGDDHLHGGAGADHLHGGAGSDDAIGDDSDLQTEIEHEDFGAALTGATAALGFAEFYTTLHQGINLKVEVEHGPANTTFDVFVNGAKVGTLSTDHEGEGKLKMNLTSPAIVVGTTVAVKDSLGVLLVDGTFGQSQDDHGGSSDD